MMKTLSLILPTSALFAFVTMINCVETKDDQSYTDEVPCNLMSDYLANCSYRNLTGLPDTLTLNITFKITDLNLIGNSIKQLSHMSWKNFTSLRSLSLARNELDELKEGDFDYLFGLELLDLSLNRIRYSCISNHVFKILTSLQYLDLKQNLNDIWQNETYPVELSQLQNLKYLMIDGIGNDHLPNMLNLSELYLSGEYGRCDITTLKPGYFSNVQNVQHLYISNCSIQQVSKDTFKCLPFLSSLDISRNIQLGIESLQNISFGLNFDSNITRLNLNSLYDYVNYDNCVSLEKDDLIYLFNTSLELLLIESNYLIRLTEEAVDLFPKSLLYLSVSDNMLVYGKYVNDLKNKSTLHGLVYFDTSKMYKAHVPVPKCPSTQHDTLHLEHQEEIIENQYCPDINQNFTSLCNSVLTRLEVSDDFAIMWKTMRQNRIGAAKTLLQYDRTRRKSSQNHGQSRLEYLDLSDNLPGIIQMTFEIFNNAPNLTFLNVSNNYLGYPLLDESISTDLLKSAHNLRTLDLSNNGMTEVKPADIFANLSQLEYLYLSKNALTNISFDISPLQNLRYLDLSSNHLEHVCRRTRDSIDNLNVSINFEYNANLMCTCKNIEFVKWLDKNFVKFNIKNQANANCSFANATSIPLSEFNFNQFYFECSAYNSIILATSLSILVFIITVTCSLIYRFKWNLRYLYYMTKFKLTGGYQPIDDREYEKDVFVSYANEDRAFVRDHVVNELETNGNMSLLVHDRDFWAGEFVADNIMRAITSTRRTLAVLTNAYIRSKWCMYELNMARMEASDTGRNVLCVILKEDIPVKYLPLEVMNFMKKNTYMEYPTEDEHRELFWNRLIATLSHES